MPANVFLRLFIVSSASSRAEKLMVFFAPSLHVLVSPRGGFFCGIGWDEDDVDACDCEEERGAGGTGGTGGWLDGPPIVVALVSFVCCDRCCPDIDVDGMLACGCCCWIGVDDCGCAGCVDDDAANCSNGADDFGACCGRGTGGVEVWEVGIRCGSCMLSDELLDFGRFVLDFKYLI